MTEHLLQCLYGVQLREREGESDIKTNIIEAQRDNVVMEYLQHNRGTSSIFPMYYFALAFNNI